ncbi:DsbA family oxidoreductase [Lichenicola sp.]|uniref:DsbA family oxidoreductase n=1 Tax=Lichenicola sp. TaxID=2804529 RepID=UPI003B00AC98
MNALTPIQTRLSIEVVHDFVCPWCYLGVRRLLRGLALRPNDAFVITWRPFLLNPDIPRDGLSRLDYVQRKYGGEDRARRLYATVTELGLQDGVTFRFDRMHHIPSSVEAHRLAGWAARIGPADALVEALFAAQFTGGLDIGNLEVLAGIAASVGLDRAAALAFLRAREGIDIVHSENLRAHRRGISGVPCFVFSGRLAVSGAQETEVFSRLLDVAALDG